jgi:hypothetical protein
MPDQEASQSDTLLPPNCERRLEMEKVRGLLADGVLPRVRSASRLELDQWNWTYYKPK